MNFLLRLPAAIFWVVACLVFLVVAAIGLFIGFIVKLVTLGSKSW